MPVSLTENRTSTRPDSIGVAAAVTVMSPESVNLMALLSRLNRICLTRVMSLTMTAGSADSI